MKSILISLLALFIISGCSSIKENKKTYAGAGIGTAVGAGIGGIFGKEKGALIGGVIGGGIGAYAGNRLDKQAKELEKTVPNALAPDALMNGGTMLAKASYLRIKDAILENTDLIRRILDTNKIDTLTPEELLYLRDDLSAQYMRDHPQISKNVIGVDILDPDVANVYQARVLIGQRNGELFESKAQAQNYFNRFFKKMTDDYQIVQKGEGWQIQINKTLERTGKVFQFRYHRVDITTPRQMRCALAYVLNNWRRHREDVMTSGAGIAHAGDGS